MIGPEIRRRGAAHGTRVLDPATRLELPKNPASRQQNGSLMRLEPSIPPKTDARAFDLWGAERRLNEHPPRVGCQR